MERYELDAGCLKCTHLYRLESSMSWSEPYFYEELFCANGYHKNGRPGNYVEVEGRVVLDLYRHFVRHHQQFQLSKYSLKNIAEKLLPDDPDSQKFEMEYTDIPKFQNEGSATRRHLAIYCLQVCTTCSSFQDY